MLNYNNISIAEATALQNELRYKLVLQTYNKNITTIAGGDISHNKDTDIVYAGVVVLSYPQMVLQSYSLVVAKTSFPYVPQYLGFREVPALMLAWNQLPVKPDLLVLDGQGITHPRRMGIASHFGVLADVTTIGCAKNMLFGKYDPLGLEKFNTSEIYNSGELLGYALRTKTGVKPVYISPGHKITVEDSLDVMKHCVLKHRIPEPTRLAHEKVNLFRVGKLQSGYHMADIQTNLFL
ncbi:endonuclease V [Flavobacterium alkalisoli]|uniref:Endonuclease V n=1 Tax=Flavobacterium alkalisoli TaxID=2602769 RepID=A0A5B9FWM3_9FLAO|nr:deoxyribonuclease V [Flavobacterium alkalisoli]QEE50601.1 endonuclease V [Flavobacterium alkalisoli]